MKDEEQLTIKIETPSPTTTPGSSGSSSSTTTQEFLMVEPAELRNVKGEQESSDAKARVKSEK